MFVPQKNSKVSRFHHERKIIMRKRLKLVKSSKPAPLIKSHLVMLEKQLCDGHLNEKRFEENTAVTKIKEDPTYFFRYAKKYSICKTDIGILMNRGTNYLSNDKLEMCRLLVDRFTSVFTIPDPQQIITDPVSFFAHEPNTGIHKSLFLTDIMLNEDIIIEAIHEQQQPFTQQQVRTVFLLRYWSTVLPRLPLCYCLIFITLFPMELSQKLGRELLLFRFTSLAIQLSQVIIDRFP